MTSTGPEWQKLTLWPEGTLANPLATPESDAARKTPATSGPCSLSAFAWYDPDTHCWRTSQGTLLSGSDLFSQTWPRSGMTHNGTAYQRQPSAPRTSATEYSLSLHGEQLWPTPQAHLAKEGGYPAEGRRATPSLTWQAMHGRRLLPSPQASDFRDRGGPQTPAIQRRLVKGKQINLSMTVTGQLDPAWVEWLMGFPIGWTDLED